MNQDEIWAAIDSQRVRTADLLEELTDDEWAQPSLCAGWTVRDVAAHLTLQQIGLGTGLRLAIRHPLAIFDVNRLNRDAARTRAGMPRAEIIAGIRAMVGSRRHNIGVTSMETLIDILVHTQDVAIPLGRSIQMDRVAAAAAAARVWSFGGRSKARVFDRIPFDDLEFVATDIEWSVGQGRRIEGPIGSILLVLTGRRAGISSLHGEGVAALRAA